MNVDSPPARLPLRISSHGRTATRNVRSTHRLPESACNSPVVTAAAIRLLPSLRPFPLHTVACILLLNCCSWRFDGKPASIWLAWAKRPGQPRMPQNRPWQADLLQESPRNPVLLDGRMQPHLMVRLGRFSLMHMFHQRSFHGPCLKASRIFFGMRVCRKWWASLERRLRGLKIWPLR